MLYITAAHSAEVNYDAPLIDRSWSIDKRINLNNFRLSKRPGKVSLDFHLAYTDDKTMGLDPFLSELHVAGWRTIDLVELCAFGLVHENTMVVFDTPVLACASRWKVGDIEYSPLLRGSYNESSHQEGMWVLMDPLSLTDALTSPNRLGVVRI